MPSWHLCFLAYSGMSMCKCAIALALYPMICTHPMKAFIYMYMHMYKVHTCIHVYFVITVRTCSLDLYGHVICTLSVYRD